MYLIEPQQLKVHITTCSNAFFKFLNLNVTGILLHEISNVIFCYARSN